jgi:hypothetical protein
MAAKLENYTEEQQWFVIPFSWRGRAEGVPGGHIDQCMGTQYGDTTFSCSVVCERIEMFKTVNA